MYQTVRGMRDYLPEEAAKREYVFAKCRAAFEAYGFQPLETPAVESIELLTAKGGGGEEIEKEIYAFNDKGERRIGLRYDLTVGTARVVASEQLAKPFKRYCIAKVWRYDRPQAGRYREFTQADIDVFGVESVDADLECLLVTKRVFDSLGFKGYVIKVNNKALLQAMMAECFVPQGQQLDALRSIDKLDKLGWEGVEAELDARNVEGKERLIEFLKSNKKLECAALDELVAKAKAAGVPVEYDATLVRGLEYYTGNVFEIRAGGKWSCGGGGRYDKMVELYGGTPTPAVGISYGVERVVQLMDEAGIMPKLTAVDVLVAAVNDSVRAKALEIAEGLRAAGVRCETDLIGKALRKQFDYANAKGIPRIVIVGPKDLENGEATVRDMVSGKEDRVKLGSLAKALIG
jgi:histidyl-tRNA synthetase